MASATGDGGVPPSVQSPAGSGVGNAGSGVANDGTCDLNVMVDRYDHEPKAYGATWLNCSGWGAFTGWLSVDLYRNGVHQGQGFCQMNEQLSCSTSFVADNPSGNQTWKACANYEVFPAPVAPWRLTGSDCTTAVL